MVNINPICVNCTKYGNDCAGTTCRVWTGCVYRTTAASEAEKQQLAYFRQMKKGG